ncbi:conditioned medium-induced protein 4 [Halobacterium bonnevillei]|uniref:Conditioned medium-induced protein 4 n=1 Tax=Halobacterium bonnevillei TaxID=2692200 RepID=A0A6B0SEE4_9EURY|nr:conditioned medium-induced protein 4 [Halobacterium bonnevillei]MXR19848.1 conditioned medium-induced protein 4 [Halobacterium bonnevillei]
MDEKTEELRDIFMDVADDDTVTESQEDTHGSLASEEDVEARLRDAVSEMVDNLGVDTPLAVEDLATVVEAFYAGEDDAGIAEALDADVDPETVAHTRTDLHLLREDDTDPPFDYEALRDATLGDDASVSEFLADVDADEDTVDYYRSVVETREEIRRVNDRYRAEFENVLQDRELSERLTRSVHEDGLDGATEGQETDINL